MRRKVLLVQAQEKSFFPQTQERRIASFCVCLRKRKQTQNVAIHACFCVAALQ